MAKRGVIMSIGIWLDKLREGRTLTEASAGRFRVVYPCGGESIPMYYCNALEYRNIFGGSVFHIKTGTKL